MERRILAIRDHIATATKRLTKAGIDGASKEAWLLLGKATGRDRISLLALASDSLDETAREQFFNLVDRREGREPIAQIIGEKEFWSLPFIVSKDVLCPRPDSESLIEMALDLARPIMGKPSTTDQPYRLLDFGTGSGCLVLSLLSELPSAFAIGVDRSLEALDIAKANGERLGLSSRIGWLAADWGTPLDGTFDLIVSNPPYIRTDDWRDLAPDVRLFEPTTALKAGKDGLDAYRRLAPDVRRLLAPNGIACFEHGEGQADAITNIMADAGLATIEHRKDLAGIDRCLAVKAV